MKRLTAQQVYEGVREEFVVKGTPRSRLQSQCLYGRKINGAGCAIGIFLAKTAAEIFDRLHGGAIEDILYNIKRRRQFEIHSPKRAATDREQRIIEKNMARFEGIEPSFLAAIQHWHDDPQSDGAALDELARVYDLEVK